MVDVVPTLQCMLVMYGLGILAIDHLKESFQPIIGNGRLENDVSGTRPTVKEPTRERSGV